MGNKSGKHQESPRTKVKTPVRVKIKMPSDDISSRYKQLLENYADTLSNYGESDQLNLINEQLLASCDDPNDFKQLVRVALAISPLSRKQLINNFFTQDAVLPML